VFQLSINKAIAGCEFRGAHGESWPQRPLAGGRGGKTIESVCDYLTIVKVCQVSSGSLHQ
jgi:hypothetical protein